MSRCVVGNVVLNGRTFAQPSGKRMSHLLSPAQARPAPPSRIRPGQPGRRVPAQGEDAGLPGGVVGGWAWVLGGREHDVPGRPVLRMDLPPHTVLVPRPWGQT